MNMHLTIQRMLPATLFLTLLGLAGPSVGATIVVPNTLATIEGSGDNNFPFSTNNSMRYQQIFDASDFGAFSAPELVTEIRFRPDARIGSSFASTFTSVQINLSTTSAAPDGLSLTFASNVGGDDTVVFSGSLSLTSADTGPAGGPKAFDIVIDLQTPFLYDPNDGNLLLDVRKFDTNLRTTPFDSENDSSDSISRLFSTSPGGGGVKDTTGRRDSLGLVVQFVTTTDSDGDGVDGPDDFCPDTSIPEGVPTNNLGVNRWALVDGDGIFDTVPPKGGGWGPQLAYTIEETAGCSCEQIITTLDLGKGHEEFGCSISAMEDFVELVNP